MLGTLKLKPEIISVVCYRNDTETMFKMFLCIGEGFVNQKVTRTYVFWVNRAPLLLRVFSTVSEMLEAVRLYRKQHASSTCTELRLQCLVQFIRAEATPESQMCWP